jgi:hypothetical protein
VAYRQSWRNTWMKGNRSPDVVVYVTGCMDSATTYSTVQDTISLLDIKIGIMKQQWGPISHFLPHKWMQLQGTHSMVDWNSYEVSLHKRLQSCEIWDSHGSAAKISGVLERHCVVGLMAPNVSKLAVPLHFLVTPSVLHPDVHGENADTSWSKSRWNLHHLYQ